MTDLVPPVGTTGRYTVKAPFSVNPGKVYTCSAVRKFIDVENQGIRIFETYYETMGLTPQDLAEDRMAEARLITLTSETDKPIYLPSTYITSYPDGSYRNYQRIVMAAEIGMIPDYIDLTHAIASVKDVLSDVIGIEPNVVVAVAPTLDQVTPQEAEALEAVRTAAINNRTTEYARRLANEQTITRLQTRLSIAEDILRRNGLIPQ